VSAPMVPQDVPSDIEIKDESPRKGRK
jgi:hypothetical protein